MVSNDRGARDGAAAKSGLTLSVVALAGSLAAAPVPGSAAVAAAPPAASRPPAAARHAQTSFSVRQIDGKWTFVDPRGRPFYSIGVNHVSTAGYVDPGGVNRYQQTVKAKYGSTEAWAKAQRTRFDQWGVNTVAAFSDISPFLNQNIAFTPFISTANGDTDVFDPAWAQTARRTITQAALRYRREPNLLGYFIDNELPWTFDPQALGRPDRELFIMGRYFRHPYGKAKLIAFLAARYPTPDDLRRDFPDARLPGGDWAHLDAASASLGGRVAAHGQATLDAWAQIMARRYFSVTSRALRAADPRHLNFGLKFIAGLTPSSVVKLEAPYVDVIAVDFYDSAKRRSPAVADKPPGKGKPGDGVDFESLVLPLIPFATTVPTRHMLADWYRLTGKPILIAEFSYRSADSGLPNTIPPGVAIVPNQAERARATTNYADCAIDAPYVVGLQWFELFDEPKAGRFDGENSNWGLVTESDEPYTETTEALAAANRLAARRLRPDFKPAPCTPVGLQDFGNLKTR